MCTGFICTPAQVTGLASVAAEMLTNGFTLMVPVAVFVLQAWAKLLATVMV